MDQLYQNVILHPGNEIQFQSDPAAQNLGIVMDFGECLQAQNVPNIISFQSGLLTQNTPNIVTCEGFQAQSLPNLIDYPRGMDPQLVAPLMEVQQMAPLMEVQQVAPLMDFHAGPSGFQNVLPNMITIQEGYQSQNVPFISFGGGLEYQEGVTLTNMSAGTEPQNAATMMDLCCGLGPQNVSTLREPQENIDAHRVISFTELPPGLNVQNVATFMVDNQNYQNTAPGVWVNAQNGVNIVEPQGCIRAEEEAAITGLQDGVRAEDEGATTGIKDGIRAEAEASNEFEYGIMAEDEYEATTTELNDAIRAEDECATTGHQYGIRAEAEASNEFEYGIMAEDEDEATTFEVHDGIMAEDEDEASTTEVHDGIRAEDEPTMTDRLSFYMAHIHELGTMTDPQEPEKIQKVIVPGPTGTEKTFIFALGENDELCTCDVPFEQMMEVYERNFEEQALQRCDDYASYVKVRKHLKTKFANAGPVEVLVVPLGWDVEGPGIQDRGITFPTIDDFPSIIPINSIVSYVYVPASRRLISFLELHHPIEQLDILSEFSAKSRLQIYAEWLGRIQFVSHLPYPSVERYAVFDRQPEPIVEPPIPTLAVRPIPRESVNQVSIKTTRQFIMDRKKRTETFVLKVLKCARNRTQSVERIVMTSFLANESTSATEFTMARRSGSPTLSIDNSFRAEDTVESVEQEEAPEQEAAPVEQTDPDARELHSDGEDEQLPLGNDRMRL